MRKTKLKTGVLSEDPKLNFLAFLAEKDRLDKGFSMDEYYSKDIDTDELLKKHHERFENEKQSNNESR